MEGYWIVIGASLVIPVVWAVGSALQTEGVKQKFGNLGDMTGKTREEILEAVGPPNSVSDIGDGRVLLQWQTQGYHIAIIFREGVFEGISHEHAM